MSTARMCISVVGDVTVYQLIDGKYHREDGPAYSSKSGYSAWWVNGLRHRLDGPAIIFQDGSMHWWVDNIGYGVDIYEWAEAALQYQNLPSDECAVKQYVQKVLNKQADEEI